MEIGTSRKRSHILIAALVPAISYAVFCVTGNMYTYTDNVTVAVVTSGMYGDNNFCQYLHPLFCLIIKWLNPLMPHTDVFTALIHIALIYGTGLLAYVALSSMLRKPIKKWGVEDGILCALLILAIVYFTLGMNLYGVNYTVQTAAIILTGVLVLFYGRDQEKKRFWIISGTILVSFGYLIRLEAALIFIPYILLEIAAGFLRSDNKREHIRTGLKTIGPCILIVAILLVSKFAFNAAEPYASDARYNKYRTVVEDYVMHSYSPYLMRDTGIDESTYAVSRDWILVDTDRVNADTLETIAEAGSQSAYQPNKTGWKNTLRQMRKWAFQTDLHLLVLAALTVILTVWNLIAARSVWLKIESFLAFLGGFIILFYFTYMGRAPIRVWQCVMLAALSVLILVMIKDSSDREKEIREGKRAASIVATVFQLFICVILYFGIGQFMAVSHFHTFQTPFTAKIGADDSGYEMTFDGDTLYIWPSWYDAIPAYFAKQNKLPTQRVIDHNIAIGDWTYGQQYFTDFLERIDAANPAIALLERPNTYLVDGQTKELLWYLREHYGTDIQLHYVGRSNKRKVYQLVRSDEPLEGDEDLEEQADSRDWETLDTGGKETAPTMPDAGK